MDWNALKVFIAVEQSGSLAGAARALGVNHSTVFRRLNAFEESLGGRLFERLNTGYRLTPLGEELREIANRIDGAFNDMERRIAGRDVQLKGRVRVTAPNNLAYHYLPRYLDRFRQSHPDIEVELLVSNLEVNMSSRQADIAVRAISSAPPEHLVGRKVCDIGWSLYAGAAYRDRFGLPDSIEQLPQHRLIGGAGVMRQLPAFCWLERHCPDSIVARCDDLVAISYLAEAGQGLALLPDDQQRPGLENVLPFPPGKVSHLWLLTHPDLRRVERIRRVMQHLAEAFQQDERL